MGIWGKDWIPQMGPGAPHSYTQSLRQWTLLHSQKPKLKLQFCLLGDFGQGTQLF